MITSFGAKPQCQEYCIASKTRSRKQDKKGNKRKLKRVSRYVGKQDKRKWYCNTHPEKNLSIDCYRVAQSLFVCFVVVFCFCLWVLFIFLSFFERNIGGPGACYKVLAELSPGFADTGPPRGVSTGGKQMAPRYTNIHLYFVFALSCRNKYKYKWKHQNS